MKPVTVTPAIPGDLEAIYDYVARLNGVTTAGSALASPGIVIADLSATHVILRPGHLDPVEFVAAVAGCAEPPDDTTGRVVIQRNYPTPPYIPDEVRGLARYMADTAARVSSLGESLDDVTAEVEVASSRAAKLLNAERVHHAAFLEWHALYRAWRVGIYPPVLEAA